MSLQVPGAEATDSDQADLVRTPNLKVFAHEAACYLFVFASIFNDNIDAIQTMFLPDLMVISTLSYWYLSMLIRPRCRKLVLFIAAFVGAVLLVSLVRRPTPWTVIGTFYVLKPLLYFLTGYLFGARLRYLRNAFTILALVGCVSALVSLVDTSGPAQVWHRFFDFRTETVGAIGLFAQHNKNAIMMTCAVSCMVVGRYPRWLKLPGTALLSAGVFVAGSRQAAGVLFLVLGAEYVRGLIRSRNVFHIMSSCVAAVVIVGGVLIYAQDSLLLERFQKLDRATSPDTYFRAYAAKMSLEVLMEYPVIGVGPGQWGGGVAHASNSQLQKRRGLLNFPAGHMTTIDMYWPHAMTELGLLFMTLYLTVLGTMFLALIKPPVIDEDLQRGLVYLGLGVSFMAMFSFILESSFAGTLSFAMIGAYVREKERVRRVKLLAANS